MENSDVIIKSQKFPKIEAFLMNGDIAHFGIDSDIDDETSQSFIDNPEYIWEMYKVLHHIYNIGGFKKLEADGEIYDGNLTPTIFI